MQFLFFLLILSSCSSLFSMTEEKGTPQLKVIEFINLNEQEKRHVADLLSKMTNPESLLHFTRTIPPNIHIKGIEQRMYSDDPDLTKPISYIQTIFQACSDEFLLVNEKSYQINANYIDKGLGQGKAVSIEGRNFYQFVQYYITENTTSLIEKIKSIENQLNKIGLPPTISSHQILESFFIDVLTITNIPKTNLKDLTSLLTEKSQDNISVNILKTAGRKSIIKQFVNQYFLWKSERKIQRPTIINRVFSKSLGLLSLKDLENEILILLKNNIPLQSYFEEAVYFLEAYFPNVTQDPKLSLFKLDPSLKKGSKAKSEIENIKNQPPLSKWLRYSINTLALGILGVVTYIHTTKHVKSLFKKLIPLLYPGFPYILDPSIYYPSYPK